MKPFKINRNSWHYKLNKNFLNGRSMYYDWEPKHNNFCAYWRATMFRVLFAGLLSLVCIGILSMLGAVVYTDPMGALAVVVSVIGILATVFGVIAFLQYLENRKKTNADKPDSLFMQKYKAHKAKICPMVEFK
jgi:hypothetical protein